MARTVHFRACPLCEAVCGLRVTVDDGRPVRVDGDAEDPFSRGYLCPKGASLGALHADPDRLRAPLVRGPGSLREASWEEAFAEVARRLPPILEAHGRDAVAVYLGNPNTHNLAGLLYLRPLLQTLRTKNLYSASTVDQMPKHVSSGLLFGRPGAIPVPDLDRTDLLVILGGNPRVSNGSLCTAPDFPGRLDALRARGGRLVVVDPVRTETAAAADLHLPIRPGTDALLLAAMATVLFEEDRVRLGPLAELVDGAAALREALAPFTPESTAAATGLAPEAVRALARDLADAPSAAVYGRLGTSAVAFGTLASWGVDVLNVLTGNVDRPGGAMFPWPDHEAPDRGPVGRGFTLGRWRSRVRGLPEVKGELPVATLADEIETPGPGQVRALITIAGNPVLTTPNTGRLDRALSGLELLVAVDPYVNETTRHAHVILPPPSPLERSHYDAAFYGLAVRRVARFSEAILPAAGPQEDELLARLALVAGGAGADADPAMVEALTLQALLGKLTGAGGPLEGRDPDELRAGLEGDRPVERLLDLLLRTGPHGDRFGADPEGLTLRRLAAHPHGIDHGPLVPRLPGILSTPSGKIDLLPAPIREDLSRLAAALEAPPAGGLVLVGRRHLRSNNSWMHNLPKLASGKARCTLRVHPEDARRLGLEDGQAARVRSRVGEVTVPVEVTDAVRPGVVSLPHGFGHDLPGVRARVAAARPGVSSNRLTDEAALDPLSGDAVLNGIPVEVAPA